MTDKTAALVQQVRDTIDHGPGWTVIAVFGTERDPDAVPFAYTVGLTAHDHPELVITGLPAEVAHWLLNDLAGRVHHDGQRLQDGQVLDDVIQGYQARLRAGVASEDLHPGMVRAVYGAFAGSVLLQLLWPDNRGRFPDQPGYDPRMIQPLVQVPL